MHGALQAAAKVATASSEPSIAEKIMAGMGYRKGMGLGRRGTGMTSALGHKTVGTSRGVIVELSGKRGGPKQSKARAAQQPAKRTREREGVLVGFVAASSSSTAEDGEQGSPTLADLQEADTAAAFDGCTDPARVVWFRNLGNVEEANDELVEDFVEGCQLHAPVAAARLRVDASSGSIRAGVGVEVLFADAQGAAKAAAALRGKGFGGGAVVVDSPSG